MTSVRPVINTDIDGFDIEGDETEPKQVNNELGNENQKIIIGRYKKKTSVAHLNFTLNKQNNTYSCIYCSITYKASKDGSTSTLIEHLRNKHSNLISGEKKVVVEAMDKFVKQADELKFTQDNWCNDLIKWVVVNDQPFTVVEDDHFKLMIKRLNREATIPSTVTICKDIHQAFNDKQTFILEELQNVPGQISFTLDAWTSKNQIPFLGITAHWITIAFFQVLKNYKLLTKLLGVTSDNASNMNTFFDYFKKMCNENNVTFDIEHQRVRCFAHIINLAAQDALKSLKGTGPDSEEEVLNNKVPVGVIAKLRILVTKIRASPQRRERFSMQCTVLKIKDLELIPDIRTRWNSTYMIMNRALYLREPLHYMASADNELKIYLLSDEDWNRIQEVESLMEVCKYI
ncbi:hypothetical protein RirG_123660 [Rhizophagus irregularis DAOM 197198w]|uniref:BED-type domain-containing protein n=2 Tax=Rhizophagus irregularis TaxID=588596 RepID=A0A015JH54_RHIIW|nr:hypothetical protein RirG_123660 [Rhizophagus irregularis DAOM 197198w]